MPRNNTENAVDTVMQLLSESGLSGMSEAFRIVLDEAMKIERSKVLEAQPYERTESRRGYANGYKPKTVATRLGDITFAVPQARDIDFYPSALEKGVRSERALKTAIAEMYVNGVSTRKVTSVMKKMCGLDVSSSQVSRASQLLDDELSAWRERPIGETPYLLLDARYEKVRHGASVVSCAVFVAVGINSLGSRSLLGVSVSFSEAEIHWREFISGLQARGLHGVRLVVSDDHSGLRAACNSRFVGVPWQRCQFHLQKDAISYVPRYDMRSEVGAEIRSVFNAPNRKEAERLLEFVVAKYQDTFPKLAEWLADNIPEGLTVFALPAAHRRLLRTSNMLERVNREIKRRTRVATLFPNEAALLRVVSAVLMEISEEWESQGVYLHIDSGM